MSAPSEIKVYFPQKHGTEPLSPVRKSSAKHSSKQIGKCRSLPEILQTRQPEIVKIFPSSLGKITPFPQVLPCVRCHPTSPHILCFNSISHTRPRVQLSVCHVYSVQHSIYNTQRPPGNLNAWLLMAATVLLCREHPLQIRHQTPYCVCFFYSQLHFIALIALTALGRAA